MENFDHYKEARELAEKLRKDNIENFADKIIGAMREGSTGTEIFMALHWNIKNLLNTKDYTLSKPIQEKASRLYKELDKALHAQD